MTRADALEALESGEFEQFVGAEEGLEIEFKGEPYRVDARDSQKFELAKDVSAFANAGGGVIIIGAQTEREDQVAVDVVTQLRLLEQGLVDEQQYEAIAADMIYPRLRELQVRFYPSAADRQRGLVAIDVPRQEEIDKYFLIQRPMEEGVDRTPGWLVGLAVRGIGRVEERRIGEIHALINRGLVVGGRLGDALEGIAELRELLAGGAAAPAESPADRLDALLAERIDEIGA
jgi:Putative DNA-binding domain